MGLGYMGLGATTWVPMIKSCPCSSTHIVTNPIPQAA